MTVEMISWSISTFKYGTGRDLTRNPWICNQTRICSQTGYRLRYTAWSYLLCLTLNIFSRISELSSRLLKSGSSDVTELSDPYRPMKLAEELNCVYDNEWTDCYEFFTEEKNMKDDEAIDLLFAMIQVSTQSINLPLKRFDTEDTEEFF